MGLRAFENNVMTQCLGTVRRLVACEVFFCGEMRPCAGGKWPAAAVATDKERTGAVLRDAVRQCTRCALHSSRTHTVFGEGDLNAALVFVGEAPGREEDATGRPFVGEAGRLLTKIIEAMGLRRESVFITNVLRCRPPQNRDPQPEEVGQCRPYLEQLLQIIKPRVICALGKQAAWALLNEQKPISKLRGTWREFQHIPLLPTFHPAYLLRNPADKKLVWQDMQKIMSFLKTREPQG